MYQASGGIMNTNSKIAWTAGIGTVFIWLAVAFGATPDFAALIDGEVWLTNHFADPILFAFVTGAFLAALAAAALVADWKAPVAFLKPLLEMRFSEAEEKDAEEKTEAAKPLPEAIKTVPPPAAPKPVVLETPAPKAEIVVTFAHPAPAPIEVPVPPIAKSEPPRMRAEPQEKAPAKPQTATEPKTDIRPPAIRDLAMPNPPVQLAAQWEKWDRTNTFKAWQVAWLWNGWEPMSENMKGKPSLATYQRFEHDLEKGLIQGAARGKKGWKTAVISRQALVDYALELGERPLFLFAEDRSWMRRKLREWRKLEVDPATIGEYTGYGETKLELYKVLQIINSDAVAAEVKNAMLKGGAVGIARRQYSGIAYGYERIPRAAWRRLAIDWIGNVTGRNVAYTGLLVKFKDGYYGKPADRTSEAVEAYGAIERFVRNGADPPIRRHG
jgi:hypothetical protein